MAAAIAGHTNACTALLAAAASVNATGNWRNTALHWAALGGKAYGAIESVSPVLADAGAGIDALMALFPICTGTALHVAAFVNNVGEADVLLKLRANILQRG